MDNFETFVTLMFAAAILVGIAQKIGIPYPIALVFGGAAIGFTEINHTIHFDPNLILIIVLPPILYYAAFGISFREFKFNWRKILSLALGLVMATTVVVGLLFKWIFPQFSWALAFAFGAIVSPPDATAATTILKRFAIGNRLLTILEGESLVNDASALVLYKIAVIALLAGSFSFSEGAFEFVKVVVGGIAVGLTLGYLLQYFSRYLLEPVVGVVFSFTIPYVTFILANALEVSGVLAVVTNGLIGSRILLRHHSSLRRILGFASWDIFIILLNCFVFILIGLQLQVLTSALTTEQMLKYTGYACLLTLVMFIIRFFWSYSRSCVSYFQALYRPHANLVCPQILREATLIGWSGMRGIVSLAAALALPFAYSNGLPLEGRNEVIFLTFMVILLTLVIPGFTLSYLVRALKIAPEPESDEALLAKKKLSHIAEETIDHLYSTKAINEEEFSFLKEHFNLKRQLLEISPGEKKQRNLEEAKSRIIQSQRRKLFELWEHFEIGDKTLTQIEHELDLEETQLARANLK